MRFRAPLLATVFVACLLLGSPPASAAGLPSPKPCPTITISPSISPGKATPSPSPSPSVQGSPSPSPAGSPSPAQSPRLSPTPTPDAAAICRAEAEKKALDDVRQRLGGNLAEALGVQQQLARSLTENTAQQELLRKKIDENKQKVKDLETEIRRLETEMETTRQRIEQERTQIADLARAIYVEPTAFLILLVQSSSLSDTITRVSDLASAGARARMLKGQLASDLSELDSERTRQKATRDEMERIRADLESSLVKLEDLKRKQQDTKTQLESKIQQTQNQISDVDRQSAELAARITAMLQFQQQAIIATAMQQVWDQVRILLQQGVPGGLAPPKNGKYKLVWPQPASQISQGFGPSPYWFEPAFKEFPHFHTGLDLVEPDGGPILAADSGLVLLTGEGTTGYGNFIVLAHGGGVTTLYGHLSHLGVKQGDSVTQGQAIGLEGSTGNSTGPHLHFEVRFDGVPLDPIPYLPPGPPS